jgi:hypothetical protein
MTNMTEDERTFLLDRLAGSEARLLALVEGLTAEQWMFREEPERWSIAENVEHLALFERFIRGVVVKILSTPAEQDKVRAVMAKHDAVLGLAVVGEMKIQAREVVRPAGGFADLDELKETLWRERAETIAFAREVQADLRQHFFAHLALGDLDGYEWLLVIAQHSDRHAAQIKRVMSDSGFPRIAPP